MTSASRNLLSLLADQHRKVPLADALRPQSLNEVLGQQAVLGPGTPLRNLFEAGELTSLLLWGPPGVGKTTLARLLSQKSNARFVELSAVNTGLKELREAVQDAQEALQLSGQTTVVFIDEIHRYAKPQQDAMLPAVENGTIVLIGATTENPAFQVIPALLSRLLLVRLGALAPEDIESLLQKGAAKLGCLLPPEALGFLVRYANGDGRSALNLLETAFKCAPQADADASTIRPKEITISLLEQLAQQNRVQYDKDGDAHYDHASAYQKSMRGSDADAAIYWLAKMLAGGEDPRFIARRLLVTAAEDVGLADPQAFVIASQAAEAVERLGLPEGRIPLAMATIYIARAPKSNQAIVAIDAALRDITQKGKNYPVPAHLRDAHYKSAETFGHGTEYIYTHSQPDAVQTFLPPELIGTLYVPDRDSERQRP